MHAQLPVAACGIIDSKDAAGKQERRSARHVYPRARHHFVVGVRSHRDERAHAHFPDAAPYASSIIQRASMHPVHACSQRRGRLRRVRARWCQADHVSWAVWETDCGDAAQETGSQNGRLAGAQMRGLAAPLCPTHQPTLAHHALCIATNSPCLRMCVDWRARAHTTGECARVARTRSDARSACTTQ